MDQNLAHISYKRVTKPIVFYDHEGSLRVAALLQEFQGAFRLFLDHVDEQFKIAFRDELRRRRAAVENIQLP
jgi:hypothetical protein